jgi:hypothetical protein
MRSGLFAIARDRALGFLDQPPSEPDGSALRRFPRHLLLEKRVRLGESGQRDDPTAPPAWEQLDGPRTTTAELIGDTRVENDDQIMVVYFVDATAREQVTRGARDAAALAQECPRPPAAPVRVERGLTSAT